MNAHIVPKPTYYTVFATLGVLLVLTVLAAQVDVGAWNAPVALMIALAKAALIVLFFMHVRYGTPLLRIFAIGGFLWLLIMFILMLPDFLAREAPGADFGNSAVSQPSPDLD